jgi:hypothetical protein
MSKDNDYIGVLLEDIRDQNKAVLEAVVHLKDKVNTLATQDSLNALSSKVTTIHTAVTDTNKDLIILDSRVSVLEQA